MEQSNLKWYHSLALNLSKGKVEGFIFISDAPASEKREFFHLVEEDVSRSSIYNDSILYTSCDSICEDAESNSSEIVIINMTVLGKSGTFVVSTFSAPDIPVLTKHSVSMLNSISSLQKKAVIVFVEKSFIPPRGGTREYRVVDGELILQ
jgi:hypothetical protein